MLSSPTFFEQNIRYKDRNDRKIFFELLCRNKTVLHIGCADWPIFSAENNLQIFLFSRNHFVEGYDKDVETIQKMSNLPELANCILHTKLPDKKYDVLLIPETIEHVGNPQEFLQSLLPLVKPYTQIIVTAPNAFCDTWIREIQYNTDFIRELVHPDHKCWYSPYTLSNTIREAYKNKGCDVEFIEIGVLDNKTMVYVIFTIKTL